MATERFIDGTYVGVVSTIAQRANDDQFATDFHLDLL
jgi:hypothetical protein